MRNNKIGIQYDGTEKSTGNLILEKGRNKRLF